MPDARTSQALAQAEEAHFWHRSRNEYIEGQLRTHGIAPPMRLVELGCGGGCVLSHLASRGYRMTGIEGHLELGARAALRAPQAQIMVHDLELGAPPDLANDHDAALLCDVIEHLDSPAAALALAGSMVRRGGLVVGTVPALRFLWSRVDEVAGHKVRYQRRDLARLLSRVPGLDLVQVAYFNMAHVPLMWATRRRLPQGATEVSEQNLKPPPRVVNELLYRLSRAEHELAARAPAAWPLGASLFFVLRRA
jgi:SAM-dependent methyltransferase